MGRLVRVVIYAVVIVLLYFWITAIITSYSKSRDKKEQEIISTDTIIKDSLLADTFGMGHDENAKMISNEDIVDGKINYKEVDAKVNKLQEKKTSAANQNENIPSEKTKSAPKQEVQTSKPAGRPAIKPDLKVADPPQQPKKSDNITGDGGKYLVMAGSYLLKENALKMVKKLRNMGYANAELIVFTASEYHSVIAVRFSSEIKAQNAAAELKRKGVDSFVKIQ
jgi:cell division septation protein DedD